MDEQIEFSSRASLVALGLRMQHLGLWTVIGQHVTIKQKVLKHTPLDKLLDCFINILAGGIGLVEVNTRVRPDRAVQRAFGRNACAEQSTISDRLNNCSAEQVNAHGQVQQITLNERHPLASAFQAASAQWFVNIVCRCGSKQEWNDRGSAIERA